MAAPARTILIAVLAAASSLTTVPPAAGAPLLIEDINPDSSIIAQGQNNSQGGRVNGLKVPAGQNQIAYAASEWGGIFRTTDGAQTWAHLDGHEPQVTFDVDVDPSDIDRVYATSLYDGRTNPLSGISISDDGGGTWTHPFVPNTSPVCDAWDEPSAFGLAVLPDDTDTVVVGTACGVAVTHDAGTTWTHVDPNPSTDRARIWDVAAQPGGIVDICGRDGHFRSTDFGDEWEPGSLGDRSDVCSIAASPLETDVLYVTQNQVALWESSDGGATWTMLEDSLGNRRAFVVTNQTGADTFDLYFGTGPRLRVVQGCDDSSLPTRCPAGDIGDLTLAPGLGAEITGDAHLDMGDLEFDPTDAMPQCPYLLSTDGGVYRSDDCAPTWVRAMVGLHDTWLYDLAVGPLPGNQTAIHFGLMDSGRWYSLDGGATWGNPTCCDIWDVVVDADRLLYTQCCPTTILRTTPADDPTNVTSFESPIIVDPDNPPTNPWPPIDAGWPMWFQEADSIQAFGPDSYVFVTQTGGNADFETPGDNGSGGIWITENAFGSYTQLGAATTPENACSVEVAVSGGVPTFYVVTDDDLNENTYGLCNGRAGGRLWKYTGTDPNSTWTEADTGLTAVGIFGVDPNDQNRLLASDLTASGPRMVASTDGGASWNPVPTLDALMTGDGEFNYQNTFGPEVRWPTPPLSGYSQPTSVAFHPSNPNVIVAGANDSGLFVTTDAGASWALVTEDLPRVWHPAFDPFDDSVFYVGTVGRGVWKITLPDANLSITKTDDPEPAVAGESLTYTLTISNTGPDDAANTRVVDVLPEGVQHVSNDGGCVEAPAGTLTCDLGTLTNGDVQEIEITVDVAPDLVHEAGGPTTTINSATVSAAVMDPDPSNNAAVEQTEVVAVADLEIVSFEAVDPPSEILVGVPTEITLRKVITNHGPSAPMDVRLTTEATASPGTTVVPSDLVIEEPALALAEQREVEEVFTVECQEGSNHSFTFENTIEPASAEDSDPDLSNNEATVHLDVLCVVPVQINIKPGGFPNSVNLGSKGVIPVAILNTQSGEYGLPLPFDPATIDVTTVRFGPPEMVFDETGGAFETHGVGHPEDSWEMNEITKDGDTDLVLHFRTQETGLGPADTDACVKGEWIDGIGGIHKFFGCDSIQVVPPA